MPATYAAAPNPAAGSATVDGSTGDWSLGRVSAAGREDGILKAGANPRGMQGYAVGR